jgi:hypothetical protein
MAAQCVGCGLADPAQQVASIDRGVQGQAMTHDDKTRESVRHFSGHTHI